MSTYPGTTRPILPRQHPHVVSRQPAPDDVYRWDAKPYILAVEGFPREFFTIGHLSGALLRSAMTVRGWEAQGFFPKPTFTVNGGNKYAKRRLYTRRQIEGVIQIAQEEGILDSRRRYLTETDFTPRCFALFAQCRDVPPPLHIDSEDNS